MSIRVPIGGKNVRLGAEIALNTPVSGGNDTVVGSSNRYYTFFTTPSTAAYYVITGIEIKNGTVVNGSWQAGIETVDANLPTSANTSLLAFSPAVSQSGTSAVQRNSQVFAIVPANTIVGAWVVSNSASGRMGTTTVASGNRLRAIALGAPANTATNAWVAGTEEIYIKVYAKPVL